MRIARVACATESRMTSAGLVQTNGFAAYLLCAAMKRRSSLRRSLTLVNEPRRIARRSSWPNHPSTALSQEALVGVKCSVKREWAASQAVTSGVLCVLLLSSTRCSARRRGTVRSIFSRNRTKSAPRCCRVTAPNTLPVATSKAAYRLAVPWRV
jgi:hypothetical protein